MSLAMYAMYAQTGQKMGSDVGGSSTLCHRISDFHEQFTEFVGPRVASLFDLVSCCHA